MHSVFTQIFNLPGLSLATRPLEKSLGVGEVRLSLFAASRLLQYSHLFCWSSWSQYVISWRVAAYNTKNQSADEITACLWYMNTVIPSAIKNPMQIISRPARYHHPKPVWFKRNNYQCTKCTLCTHTHPWLACQIHFPLEVVTRIFFSSFTLKH